jgi:UDP-N-acetylmuramoyl-L-alanyl-D-glutamate--2,6-diaminopimelate ligase
MAANAALAIVMLVEAGYLLADIAHVIERDHGINVFVPGRAEIVSGAIGPVVYVDYGHTPDAFAKILAALRRAIGGKIVMVFGADGDRDASKRAEMGQIAAQGADAVVITDYHPRTEDPAAIRAQLLAGARSAQAPSALFEVADPAEAVRFAVTLVGEGDAILYAGPGHENYREVAGKHLDYDARDDVRLALREAGWMDTGAQQ